MAQYINKDTYVGNTGKQLKDIKTNADNISSNSASITNIGNEVNTVKTNLNKIKDYVTDLNEYGSQELDDKWYHRSFNSGFGELFRRIVISNITINHQETSSDYYYDYNIDLPDYFGRKPIVNVTAELSGGYGCHYVIGNVTNKKITGWIYTDVPRTNVTVILHVYCVGR